MSGEWMDDVRRRYRLGNEILFDGDSEFFKELTELLKTADRITAISWALELAGQSVEILERRHPYETRPRSALTAASDWAHGNAKMPFAKRCILDCHALAKELSSPEERALCHAIGQACSVVHTKRHALGYPLYELTSMVHRYGSEHCEIHLMERMDTYVSLLDGYIGENLDSSPRWAAFLLK